MDRPASHDRRPTRLEGPGAKLGGKTALAAFDFPKGSLVFTEAGTKHRASLHVFADEEALRVQDPGGLESFAATFDQFRGRAATAEPHPQTGAHRPAICSAASATPIPTRSSTVRACLRWLSRRSCPRPRSRGSTPPHVRSSIEWIERLRAETGEGFPEKVTAFRPGMAVHGRFGEPCPVVRRPVQRIRYADNETNYCPRCQTGGRILADRSLSRLLKDAWGRVILTSSEE